MDGGIPAAILTLSLAGATLVKLLVDIVRIAYAAPKWVPPTLALVLSCPLIVALQVAGGKTVQTLTQGDVATAVLAGILAAGTAIGVTSVASHAQPTRPPAERPEQPI